MSALTPVYTKSFNQGFRDCQASPVGTPVRPPRSNDREFVEGYVAGWNWCIKEGRQGNFHQGQPMSLYRVEHFAGGPTELAPHTPVGGFHYGQPAQLSPGGTIPLASRRRRASGPMGLGMPFSLPIDPAQLAHWDAQAGFEVGRATANSVASITSLVDRTVPPIAPIGHSDAWQRGWYAGYAFVMSPPS